MQFNPFSCATYRKRHSCFLIIGSTVRVDSTGSLLAWAGIAQVDRMAKFLDWQLAPAIAPPEWLVAAVKCHAPTLPGHRAAQLLWQRGIQAPEQLDSFLDPQHYQPASPYEFGQEMQWAVQRLQQARDRQEIVAIWGDFDADGLTATAVLWEGLGQFFTQDHQLYYTIPNRLIESHGLSCQGIDALVERGCHLIVTCDTGSTNLREIDYAQDLGLDVIITDHHTLPAVRPPVTAIVNPRYLKRDHPLFHLSGVAVAYKLVEALYAALPDVPQQPLEELLDLVAIGLIADLVQLTGDCRYLAQQGIAQLQQQLSRQTRPGVARLLELCKKTGDRPTDISFGLGPRINAVSRIQGDARFCVELLTSRDVAYCHQLAAETELANHRRKSLQKEVARQVQAKLNTLDLSTTSVIVLADDQWPAGVLGLVAAQVAAEQNRPTILLSIDPLDSQNRGQGLARGSARSTQQIDLYQLVKAQAHLLHRFGGHPFAAGLSLPIENLTLFTEAVNQQLRQQTATALSTPTLEADLVVTVADLALGLGKTLFQELKLLEPYGMGNPVPKLLIQNCWFEAVWHKKVQDFIKTRFKVRDDSSAVGFSGVWWGHYKEEVPQGRCDAIVELDHNSYHVGREKPHYEVRLIAVRPCVNDVDRGDSGGYALAWDRFPGVDWILDWRDTEAKSNTPSVVRVEQCPTCWHDLYPQLKEALETNQKLAIAYPPAQPIEPIMIWEQLVGIAKYLERISSSATYAQLQEKLGISEFVLRLGLEALKVCGFAVFHGDSAFEIAGQDHQATAQEIALALERFSAAVQEEQFHRQYFSQVPLATIQAVAQRTI